MLKARLELEDPDLEVIIMEMDYCTVRNHNMQGEVWHNDRTLKIPNLRIRKRQKGGGQKLIKGTEGHVRKNCEK